MRFFRNHARHCFRELCLGVLMISATTAHGRSQSNDAPTADSRNGILAALQAEKLKASKPYQPDRAEALLHRLEKMILLEPSGWYPYFSSVYPGGGLTGGAGYRKFYGDNTNWYVQGMYSFSNYKLLEGGTESRDHLSRRFSFGSRLGWRDATEVPFYGLGMKSDKDDRTSFRFQETYADGHVAFRPVKWFVTKASLAYEHWELKEGEGSFPSIETQHTAQTAPGLGVNPSFVHTQGSAGIDWRRSPGYTRTGGLYEVTLHDYHNTSGGTYSFQKLTGEVIQHVPLRRETWVLAARGRVETILNDGDIVPFYLLPKLGDGSTLRAYGTDRFRDRHSMLMNAEVRWVPSVAVDMAFFYDAGKVTSKRNDLSFQGLKSDVGIGVRIHGLMATPVRLDVAVGNEGWRIVLSGGPVF